MKTSASHAELQLWIGAPAAATLLHTDRLAVVRFELIERDGAAAGWLDLTFADGGRTCVLPGIIVDLPSAVIGDPRALVWPRSAAALIASAQIDALADLLLGRIAAWTSGRLVPSEAYAMLAPCTAFDAARAAEDLGAAPLAVALPHLGPWLHAARLAGSGPVTIEARDAARGAAVLRRFGIASSGRFDERAAAWYDIASIPATESPTLVVTDFGVSNGPGTAIAVSLREPTTAVETWRAVGLQEPVPMDPGLVFEWGDGPVVRRWWVRAVQPPARPPAPVPPPIPVRRPAVPLAFIARSDLWRSRDADTDELDELLQRARSAGVDAAIVAADQIGALDARSLPIALGDVRDAGFCIVLETLARRGTPFLAWLQPFADYPDWHERAFFAAVRGVHDDARFANAVRAYDLRALIVGDVAATEPPDAAALRARLAAALATASAVLLPASQGLGIVAQTYGLGGRPLLPILPIAPSADLGEDAVTVCGTAPYVFVHASAEPRSGILTALAALRDAPIPTVIATDAADPAYAQTMRLLAGPQVTVLVDPSPGLLDGLYRRATVFLDLALRPHALARIVRAARAGAVPVVFADSPFAALLDPLTVVPRRGIADLRDALTVLWHSPLRARYAQAASTSLGKLDRPDDAVAELFGAVCDLTGG